jgi:hypothetical protein
MLLRSASIVFVAMAAVVPLQGQTPVERLVEEILGPQRPIEVGESKPVVESAATFILSGQTLWPLGKKNSPNDPEVLIDINLRITNNDKAHVLFPTFDAFHLKITRGDLKVTRRDKKEVQPSGGRYQTIFTPAVLIPPGVTYTLTRRATIQWNEKEYSARLRFDDGTGSVFLYGPLEIGQEYQLSFCYQSACQNETVNKTTDLRKDERWCGAVTTETLRVRISAPRP